MKILTLVSSLLVSLLSLSAHAVDFSGHWKGTGQITQKSWTGTTTSPCANVEIQAEQVSTDQGGKITIQSYKATCGMISPDWGPNVMEIRGTKVFEEDEETGTLEGDTLKTLSSSGGVAYAFNMRLKTPEPNQPLVLESYYGVQNMIGTIVIEGNLSIVPPPSRD